MGRSMRDEATVKATWISRFRLDVSTVVLLVAAAASAAPANVVPEWLVRLPVGASLTAGIAGIVVDAAGVSYITGISGSSSNTDITTAAYAPDGSLLWSRTFNGPADWHDQARGLALGPGGLLHVTGNTPGPGSFANLLLLTYDAATGDLLNTIQYSGGPSKSEHGASVATDAAGNVYVAGGTTGDGGDALILAFDPDGDLLWKRIWDGPALAPYSQDTAFEILVDPNGDPIVLIHGVMASLHPDYVVVKYSAGDGTTIWDKKWGGAGEDSPRDMEIDAQGDVFVTGTGLNFRSEYSTIKLRGSDGGLVWQAFDSGGFRNGAAALTLDRVGGVYVTGTVDPDGDQSNQNDNIYSVKRNAADGAPLWTHAYGANCLYCFDAAADVSVDAAGNVFVAGTTSSPPYAGDGILLVLDSKTGLETERGINAGGPTEAVYSRELRLDPASNLLLGAVFYNANTGQVDMSVAKYAALGGGGGIPCADTSKLVARCMSPGPGNKLQARLTMTDGSHDGEPVTFEVDGAPQVVSIDGSVALLVIGGVSPGSHTVELTQPAGCFTPRTPVCPAN
jgi:hypothetical protein